MGIGLREAQDSKTLLDTQPIQKEKNILGMGGNVVVTADMVRNGDIFRGINDKPVNAFAISIETHTAGMGPRVQAIRLFKGIASSLEENGIKSYSVENEVNTNGYHEDLPNVIGQVRMGTQDDGEEYATISMENATKTYIDVIGKILRENNVDKDQEFRIGFGSVGYEGITSFAITKALEHWEKEMGYTNLSAISINFDSTYHSGQIPSEETIERNGVEYPLDPCNPQLYQSTEKHQVVQISTNTWSTNVNTLSKFAGRGSLVAAATHPLPQETMNELLEMNTVDKRTARKALAQIYVGLGVHEDITNMMVDDKTKIIDIEMNQEYFTGTQGQGRKFLTNEQIEDVHTGAINFIESLKLTEKLFSEKTIDKNILILAPQKLIDEYKNTYGFEEQDGVFWFKDHPNLRFTVRQRMKPEQMKILFRASDLVFSRSSQMNTTLESALVTPIIVDTMPGLRFMHSDLADDAYANDGLSFNSATNPEDLAMAIAFTISDNDTQEYLVNRQIEYIKQKHSPDSGVDFFEVVKHFLGIKKKSKMAA